MKINEQIVAIDKAIFILTDAIIEIKNNTKDCIENIDSEILSKLNNHIEAEKDSISELIKLNYALKTLPIGVKE